MHVCLHVCKCVGVCACRCAGVCLCVCTYVCRCVCVCMCVSSQTGEKQQRGHLVPIMQCCECHHMR